MLKLFNRVRYYTMMPFVYLAAGIGWAACVLGGIDYKAKALPRMLDLKGKERPAMTFYAGLVTEMLPDDAMWLLAFADRNRDNPPVFYTHNRCEHAARYLSGVAHDDLSEQIAVRENAENN